jgi:hypothetical protein
MPRLPGNPRDSEFDRNRLRERTDQMIDAITSPPFVEAMRQLREVPVERRLAEGARLLDPAALRAAGVPLPDDMRITSRYFEPGKPGVIEVGPDRNHHDLKGFVGGQAFGVGGGPRAIGGCACGGGLTFCGGAGGSS